MNILQCYKPMKMFVMCFFLSYVLEDLSFPTFCIRFLITDGCGEVFTTLKATVKLILSVELNVQGHLFIPSSSTTISWRSTLMTTSSPMMLLIIISDHSSLNLKLHNHINDFINKPVHLIKIAFTLTVLFKSNEFLLEPLVGPHELPFVRPHMLQLLLIFHP